VSEPDWLWLPFEAVIDLHAEQLEEHGGAVGLRDENALRSALARPQNLALYEPDTATAFRLAAAYAYGLTQNHAFVDGNKRIAFVAAATFLLLNGWYLDALETEAERMMLALSAKEIDEHAFTAWLEQHSIRP
jgi:death on curing protein